MIPLNSSFWDDILVKETVYPMKIFETRRDKVGVHSNLDISVNTWSFQPVKILTESQGND